MPQTGRGAKKTNILDKKIPENPKFKHVKSTIDTETPVVPALSERSDYEVTRKLGQSVTKYMEKIEDIRKNYRFRKDEIFKRMKATTFAQLVIQVAQVVSVEMDREQLSTADTPRRQLDGDEDSVPGLNLPKDDSGSETSRSTLQSVIRGIGEFDLKEQKQDDEERLGTFRESMGLTVPDPTSLPFLLLDVRDKDQFDQCHIIGALNYPIAMLSRSVNYFTKEILEFRNKHGKIIILYDEDERVATSASTIFVQRDVDNVFMLSGGMKVLAKKFPGCFITGILPPSCIPTPPPTRKANKKPASTAAVPSEQKHLEWFTSERLEKISDLLDEALLSEESSRMSSRVSSRSTASKASTRTTASQNSSRSTSRPWK